MSDSLKKEKAKKISIIEGCCYSVMDGFGLRYVSPFLVALGASNAQVGLLTSLPSFIGNLGQLLSHYLMKHYTRRQIVITGVFSQATSWLFLLLFGWLFSANMVSPAVAVYSVIGIYTMLSFLGAFPSPAWGSWMHDLVTVSAGAYFGRRNRYVGIVAIFCMILAGILLDSFKQLNVFYGFCILFFIAFLGRSMGGIMFTRQYEPPFTFRQKAYFSFFDFIKSIYKNNFGRFVIFVAATQFAVNIGGPFVAVYMLKELNFSYLSFTIISMVGGFVSPIFMPFWGKFADRYGNLTTMKVCLPMTVLVILGWACSMFVPSSFVIIYLFFVEALSGFAWAGFNLCVLNFVYDAVSRERIALCIAYLNICTGIGVLLGASIGGVIASLSFSLSPLIVAMFVSAFVRLFAFAVSFFVKEVRQPRKLSIPEIREKIIHLTPMRVLKLLDLF